MVSTAMQGGCTCENASLLRIEQQRRVCSPLRPQTQGMNTANDWTKELSTQRISRTLSKYKSLPGHQDILLNRGEHFLIITTPLQDRPLLYMAKSTL